MKERPILLADWEVRAILDGRKTVFRRPVKFDKPFELHSSWKNFYPHPCGGYIFTDGPLNNPDRDIPIMAVGRTGKPCPYGQPVDRLWVKEPFSLASAGHGKRSDVSYKNDWVRDDSGDRDGWWKGDYFVESDRISFTWRSGRSMPRWASRITLEVTGVRVERVQDITRQGAKDDGFHPSDGNGLESWDGKLYGNAELAFRAAWDSRHAKTGLGWDVNPFVWVVEFRRVDLAL